MKQKLGLILLTLAALGAAASSPAPSEMMAGISVIDITPPVGHRMAGYGSFNAEGLDAPLLARVLVLKTDTVSLALVSTDLVWFYSDRVVTEAKAQWGLDHVILHGTHTHAGPAVDAYTGLNDPSIWYTPMEDAVIATIGDAADAANLFPARVRAGSGPLESHWLAYNRRKLMPDGSVQMVWTNPSREPLGPIDPTVRVLRVDDTQTGEPRIVLVHFAAHPVVLGSDNRDFSPDFAGFAAAHVEQEMGNGLIAMFLQGGGGDTHPFECGLSGSDGHQVTRATGASLATNALQVLQAMDPEPPSGPASLEVMQSTLHFARRANPAQLEPVGVMAVLIDNAIALGAISGEPFVQLQLNLVDQSPVEDTFLLGFSYYGLGIPLTTYLPTVQAAEEGGYGAENTAILEPIAGERMIEQTSAMLRHLHDPSTPLEIATPFTVRNRLTGSTRYTNTNEADIADLPDPVSNGASYNRYQVTDDPDPASLDPEDWRPFGEPLDPVSFTMPETDGTVTLYAWYSHDTGPVPLQRATGRIVYTTVAPPDPNVIPALSRETAGYTVRITGEELDAGATGGVYADEPIGIYQRVALLTGVDQTPDAPYVTVDGAGAYPLRMKVINMAGNATVSSGTCALEILATDALPAGEPGDRFTAPGNLHAQAPYTTWTTAAARIQDAVDAAPDNATVWAAPGIYRGFEPWNDPSASVQVAALTRPVTLRGAVERERVILDGFGLRRGLLINHADATVRGLTVTNGFSSTADGGGVRLLNGLLEDCRVVGNTTFGRHGGGVFASGAGSMIVSCEIVDNAALGPPDAGASGGGLRLESGPTVRDTLIMGNRAPIYPGNGGGLSIRLGATLEHCRILNNTAEDGYMTGGIFAHGNVLLRNCLIAGNGRGRVNDSAGIGSHAHGALNLQAVNCTIAGNHGAAIATAFGGGNFYLTNTIAWGNAAAGITTASGVMEMVNCLVSSTAGMTAGSGNLVEDPRFVAAVNGNFRLLADSPAIDAGLNQPWMTDATDLDGNPRITGNAVDLGAYEHQGTDPDPDPDPEPEPDPDPDPQPTGEGDFFVVRDNPHAVVPYTSWETAAPTIQAAVDAADAAAHDHALIVVAAGVYNGEGGNVVELTRSVRLQGATGKPDDVVIDGQDTRRGILVALTTEGAEVLIANLTVTNGVLDASHTGGSGIYVKHPTIRSGKVTIHRCIVSGNRTLEDRGGPGAGIHSEGQAGTAFHTILSESRITGNVKARASGTHYSGGVSRRNGRD